MTFQPLISWLYNRTGGNLPAVMLFHLASNILGGALLVPLFSGAEPTRYYLLFTAFAWLLALVLVSRGRWSVGARRGPVPD